MQNKMMIETWVRYTPSRSSTATSLAWTRRSSPRLFELDLQEYRGVRALRRQRPRCRPGASGGRILRRTRRPATVRVGGDGRRRGDSLTGRFAVLAGDRAPPFSRSGDRGTRSDRQRRPVGAHHRNGAPSIHPGVLSSKPDWIVCLLGGNDATGLGPNRTSRRSAWRRRPGIWKPCVASPGHNPKPTGSGSPRPPTTGNGLRRIRRSRWASRHSSTRTSSPSGISSASRKSP